MAAETQAAWGAAVRGVGVKFREFFSETVLDFTPGWDPVVPTDTSDAAQDTYSGKTGAGTLTRFSEGSSIPKKNRFKLFDTAFANDQYGGQIEVTRKQLMNRDFNESFNEFTDLTSAGRVTMSKAPAQIFNGGFDTTTVQNGIKLTRYGDGDPLMNSGITLQSVIEKLINCGKTLKRTIRSQAQKWEGSETIIQTSLKWDDGIVRTATITS